MKTSVKATLIAIAVAVVLLIAGIVLRISQPPPPPAACRRQRCSTRTDSHVLDRVGRDAVTVVEFLDFECEACAAFYPIVEDLRATYAGDITYVVRYFPLPGHINSTQAALAAEAAAQQDRFGTCLPTGCSEPRRSGARARRRPLRSSARSRRSSDLTWMPTTPRSPTRRTLQRVESDKADGGRLGVSSTPSFFIDGTAVELQEWDDLEQAIEKAVNG